jgi:transketolase
MARNMSDLNTTALTEAANTARGLAIDAIHKCSSGHLGLPLGAAEIGSALFGQALRCNPGTPDWINRDRFLLSAGLCACESRKACLMSMRCTLSPTVSAPQAMY